MDDHGINIGNIQPCLNDGSGNQHINISIYKTVHNVFQFPLAHLPVGKIHSCLRHQLCNTQCHICNIRYPIINIIHLPTSLFSRFTQNWNYATIWWIPEDGQKHDLYLNWDEGFIYDDANRAVAYKIDGDAQQVFSELCAVISEYGTYTR